MNNDAVATGETSTPESQDLPRSGAECYTEARRLLGEARTLRAAVAKAADDAFTARQLETLSGYNDRANERVAEAAVWASLANAAAAVDLASEAASCGWDDATTPSFLMNKKERRAATEGANR